MAVTGTSGGVGAGSISSLVGDGDREQRRQGRRGQWRRESSDQEQRKAEAGPAASGWR